MLQTFARAGRFGSDQSLWPSADWTGYEAESKHVASPGDSERAQYAMITGDLARS